MSEDKDAPIIKLKEPWKFYVLTELCVGLRLKCDLVRCPNFGRGYYNVDGSIVDDCRFNIKIEGDKENIKELMIQYDSLMANNELKMLLDCCIRHATPKVGLVKEKEDE